MTKPKRGKGSPVHAAAATASPPPRASPKKDRKRKDYHSPARKCSTSSEEAAVVPPPEYCALDLAKCPRFLDYHDRTDLNDVDLEKDDLTALQHELEAMLAHAVEYQRRVTGEIAFINTGEYPLVNLKNRPMPQYELRTQPDDAPSTSATSDPQLVQCSIVPPEDADDNVDVWPPHNIPTRFWTWAKTDCLTSIDADYLRAFKETLLDPFEKEALKEYYVNEPWKHRKRVSPVHSPTARSRQGSTSNKKNRKLSVEKKEVDLVEVKVEPVPATPVRSSRRSVAAAATSSTRTSPSQLAPLVAPLISAFYRETRGGGGGTPAATAYGRARTRSSTNSDATISMRSPDRGSRRASLRGSKTDIVSAIKQEVEEEDEEMDVLSERLPIELDEQEEEEEAEEMDHDGEKDKRMTPLRIRIGKENGEVQVKQENGFGYAQPHSLHSSHHISPRSSSSSLCPRSPLVVNAALADMAAAAVASNGLAGQGAWLPPTSTEDEDDAAKLYRDVGGSVVEHLIEKGVIHPSAACVFEAMSRVKEEGEEVVVSEEGRLDGEDMDDVSAELLRCQEELQEMEPQLRGVLSHYWRRIKGDFAYWETAEQLDEADDDLFSLAARTYRDVPRKLPSREELGLLRATMKKRNAKARLHHSVEYRRQPKYRVDRVNKGLVNEEESE